MSRIHELAVQKRLLDAAPEMLAALKAYDAAVMKLTDQQLIDNQQLMSAFVDGRAIVAKAEGVSQ